MTLLLSPHLDDAAFSLGAYAAGLALADVRVLVATVFTKSVPQPRGFALACQTDKGYGPDVDYMAMRRAEDVAASEVLGTQVAHWGFAEAPHRGYGSPAALFAGVKGGAAEEKLVVQIAERLEQTLLEHRPLDVFYPLGIGDHVDHEVVIRAVERVRPDHHNVRWRQWYDQPYVARNGVTRSADAEEIAWPADSEALALKWRACAAYRSQVAYQFWGAVGEERPADADGVARVAALLGRREWVVPG